MHLIIVHMRVCVCGMKCSRVGGQLPRQGYLHVALVTYVEEILQRF